MIDPKLIGKSIRGLYPEFKRRARTVAFMSVACGSQQKS
jgi:hypothetical protein